MTSTQTPPDVTADTPDTPTPATRRRVTPARLVDVVVVGGYVALAVFVMARLWRDPGTGVLRSNEDDHGFNMVVVAHAERFLFHFENPFYTHRLNVPDGVNMMANTSVFALAVPVAPVTHFFGPAVSVVLLLTLGMAGTAAAWYWVLSRHLVRHRAAAAVGGLWCGFAPTMVSHANGQINFVAHFLVPFIVWRALRLREPGRAVPNGLALAGLIVLQIFINEEILLFTALALAVFILAYALMRPKDAVRMARPMATGLGIAALASFVVVAYPLWFQFFGPGHYRGLPFEHSRFVTDLAAYAAYPRQSLAGDTETAKRLSTSATEDNAFFGWPVLVLLALATVLVWRKVAARALVITGLVFVVLSLGPTLAFRGEDTGIRLPFWYLKDLPIIDLVSVTRFAIVVSVVAGVLLALASDRITGWPRFRPARMVWWLALVAALVPVAPRPAPVREVAPLPAFLAEGQWRSYVPEGRTVVPVPLPGVTIGRTGQRWAAMSGLDIQVPRGYFMGPANPPDDITSAWGPAPRPTWRLLLTVEQSGRVPKINDDHRRAALDDLRYWRAAVLVLGEARHQEQLRRTVTALLGREPRFVGDVWLWDVRDLIRI